MITEQELIANLDSDQKSAVQAPLDVCVVVRANAGSGKTRVLASRVTYLILKGVKGIMLLTFTNKAAKEMLSRVDKLSVGLVEGDEVGTSIISGTFHKMSAIFVRKYAISMGLSPSFVILPMSDSKAIMEKVKKGVLEGVDKTVLKDFPKTSKIMSMYSYYRNTIESQTLQEYIKETYAYPVYRELVSKIIDGYEGYKVEAEALDFDDLLYYFHEMLIRFPRIADAIHDKYNYILCDEYQDVNYRQRGIIEALDKSKTQFIVGDSAQSIYGFRGSNSRYILDFEKTHPNSKSYTIRYNYRSTGGIVNLAADAINCAVKREEDKKVMLAFSTSTTVPIIKGYLNERDQAQHICEEILANYYNLSETAILVRTNYLMRDLEFALRRYKIKYRLVGGEPFFEGLVIKDILAFIHFGLKHNNRVAFTRIISMLAGMGPKRTEQLYDVFKSTNFNYDLVNTFKVPTKAINSVPEMLQLLRVCEAIERPADKIRYICKEFYYDYLAGTQEDAKVLKSRKDDIAKLIEDAELYDDVELFFEDLYLSNAKEDIDESCLTLATVHSSKGLEWDNVFLPCLNEGVLPSQRCTTVDEIEEERRVFYVAITRARKRVMISYVNAFESDVWANIQYGSSFLKLLNKKLFLAK